MKDYGLLLPVFVLVLSSCVTISPDAKLTHDEVPKSELMVFRVSNFIAGGGGLYFGESGKYFLVLRNGEYSRIPIDAGEHKFHAKGFIGPSFDLEVDVKAGQTTCIRGGVNRQSIWALLIPVVGLMVSPFSIEEVECPTDEDLKGYELVDN